MQYRELGKTGINASILGFGAMRLPIEKIDDPTSIKEEEAIKIIRKAIDNGVNYIDSAYVYHRGRSEVVVGKALKDGYRKKVSIMTKNPVRMVETTEDYDKFLNEELERYGTEYIDVYLFHGLTKERYDDKVMKLGLIDRAKKAKADGKIKHIGFSSHDKPEKVKELIDEGIFEVILLQYNILDTQYKEVIEYAAGKGIGVCVMGPVSGGRLALEPPNELEEALSPGKSNFVDLAFKFVWSNPNVSVALSGMGSEEMVDQNLALASSEKITLTKDEETRAEKIGETYRKLSNLICTQCGYCMPCEQEVNITQILKQLIHWEVYGWEQAKRFYNNIGKTPMSPGKNAEACIECGDCEEKCPQGIPIIEKLKEAHEKLAIDG
ncbi:MAG TPA: aldo/keto reductase [candidate division Zixibacteria bacterium]|nr:aldo/keto reductase [candidate division Zixibacteria bacterium]